MIVGAVILFRDVEHSGISSVQFRNSLSRHSDRRTEFRNQFHPTPEFHSITVLFLHEILGNSGSRTCERVEFSRPFIQSSNSGRNSGIRSLRELVGIPEIPSKSYRFRADLIPGIPSGIQCSSWA